MHDARTTRGTPVREVPLLGHQPSMPAHQGIRRDKGIEFQQSFTPYRLRFPRKQRPLSIGEPNALAAQPLLQQPILGLEAGIAKLIRVAPSIRRG